mmetsp:Transcript_46443/g.101392  ORF Transcript_46443/g.101392 Transcript_46443/m.101392 type:complete len:228 (-) Transcript_46443:93-776(-)
MTSVAFAPGSMLRTMVSRWSPMNMKKAVCGFFSTLGSPTGCSSSGSWLFWGLELFRSAPPPAASLASLPCIASTSPRSSIARTSEPSLSGVAIVTENWQNFTTPKKDALSMLSDLGLGAGFSISRSMAFSHVSPSRTTLRSSPSSGMPSMSKPNAASWVFITPVSQMSFSSSRASPASRTGRCRAAAAALVGGSSAARRSSGGPCTCSGEPRVSGPCFRLMPVAATV